MTVVCRWVKASNRSHRPRETTFLITSLLVLFVTWISPAFAMVPLTEFYPFNTTFDNLTLYLDDGGSPAIYLAKPFLFHGEGHEAIFVSNNGIISFMDKNGQYRPHPFPYNKSAIIAPFWSDADIQHQGGHVFYGQRTDREILDMASCDIRRFFRTEPCFRAEWVLIATWYDVGFYGASNEGKKRRNTFQAILITGHNSSFVLFFYNKIQWTTGKNSNADPDTGTGGNPAQAGFNQGDGKFYHKIEGSTTSDIINITETSNVGSPGVWAFQIHGDNISAMQCPEPTLHPTSSTMLGGESLTLTGDHFTDSCLVQARYVELSQVFPCRIVSDTHISCVTPSVFHTGEVTLEIRALDIEDTEPLSTSSRQSQCRCQKWSFNSRFVIESISQQRPRLRRNKTREWRVGSRVSVTWDVHALPSSDLVLYLLAFKSGRGRPEWIPLDHFVIRSSTGSYDFLLNVSSPFSTFILRLSHLSQASQPTSIWSDLFTLHSHNPWSRDLCTKWLHDDRPLPPLRGDSCPTMLSQALVDSQWSVDDSCGNRTDDIQCSYVKLVHKCVHRTKPSANSTDQICCYDNHNELMNAKSLHGWGTTQRYHRNGVQTNYFPPNHIQTNNYRNNGIQTELRNNTQRNIPVLSNFEHDIVPYVHCGVMANDTGDNGTLDEFLVQRPRGDNAGYTPLMPGTLQSASVFTAVAVGGVGRDSLTILHDQQHLALLYHNGTILDSTHNGTVSFKGLTVKPEWSGTTLPQVHIDLDGSGLSVVVEATRDLLNLMVMCHSKLKGSIRGLLGNYNGRPEDDLRPRQGHSLPANSSNRLVHYGFGMTWNLSTSESLFHHPGYTSPSTYLHPNFTPSFIDELPTNAFTSDVNKICETSPECRFDYVTTGNERIAMATKKFMTKFEEIKLAIADVRLCDFPPPLPNTTVQYTSRKVGSVATYTCHGLPVMPAIVAVCSESGDWGESSDIVASCGVFQNQEVTPPVSVITIPPTTPVEVSFPVVAVAAGTACGAVVVVVVVAVIVVVRRRRRVGRTKPVTSRSTDDCTEMTEYRGIEETQQIEPQLVADYFHLYRNPAFMDILNHLTEDGTFKLPRPYLDDPQLYTEFF